MLVEEGTSGLSGIITEYKIFEYVAEHFVKKVDSNGAKMSHHEYKIKRCLDSLCINIFLIVYSLSMFYADTHTYKYHYIYIII